LIDKATTNNRKEMPMIRTPRTQKPPNTSAVATAQAVIKETKTTNKTTQSAGEHILSGANIYLIESNNSCTIRMIQKAIDNADISDSDFRQLVRTITASE
jgi:hypothetical protein